MLFDGVFGIACASRARLEVAGPALASTDRDSGLGDSRPRKAKGPSGTAEGSGGGNGEMEMLVTDAEWAW